MYMVWCCNLIQIDIIFLHYLPGRINWPTGVNKPSSTHPAVITGSHNDTVPAGGALDGTLGVLAGLECLIR